MPEPETTYTDDDLLLVGNALGAMPFDERIVRAAAVLGALLRAGWLPPSASRGLCGDTMPPLLVGGAPYSCDLLALHKGMHGTLNEDGSRCSWWIRQCMAETGESYSTAARHVDQPSAEAPGEPTDAP